MADSSSEPVKFVCKKISSVFEILTIELPITMLHTIQKITFVNIFFVSRTTSYVRLPVIYFNALTI